jgi:hypothetical protein
MDLPFSPGPAVSRAKFESPETIVNALNSLDKKLFLQFELTTCQPMYYLSRYSETSNAKLLKGKPPCFDMI